MAFERQLGVQQFYAGDSGEANQESVRCCREMQECRRRFVREVGKPSVSTRILGLRKLAPRKCWKCCGIAGTPGGGCWVALSCDPEVFSRSKVTSLPLPHVSTDSLAWYQGSPGSRQ